MKITEYDKGVVINQYDIGPDLKTIYTKDKFAEKVKPKWPQIKASTNADIVFWIDALSLLDNVDLNNLPDWFIDGLDAMVLEDIITQEQRDNFLEI